MLKVVDVLGVVGDNARKEWFMKKILLIGLLLFVCLTALWLVGAVSANPGFAQFRPTNTGAVATETQLPTERPTDTPIPPPTIDYNATSVSFQNDAIHAKETANAAIAANALITAQYEQRIQEQLQITAEAERQYFAVQSWTATGALTAIPLTSTQQVILNTSVAQNQNLIAGQLTSTHEAPTQMAAIVNVRNMEKYAKVEHGGRVFFMISGGIFLLALVAWFVRNPILPKLEEQEDQETHGINVTLRDEKNPARSQHFVLPCSEEQLSELAEMVMNGERTFAYNRMEQTSRTFRNQRETLVQVRSVLDKAELAITNVHSGESVVNDRGVAFFDRWFETHQLPDGFEVAPSPEA